MAPLVLSAQQIATCKRDTVYCLQPGTFEERRENGGSSDGVEERDTTPKVPSALPDPASEKSSGHSDTSPGQSKTKPVPMAQAKAVSKAVKTAIPTHRTTLQSTPKPAAHPKSSPHAAPKQSPKPSIQQNPSPTPMSEPPKPIPTSLSLPHSSSISPPLRGHPPGKHSPSLSPPPPQKHSISSRTRAIGAGVGSGAAVLLLIFLFFLLRHYCHRGGSNKHSNRTRKQKRKDEEAHPGRESVKDGESRVGGGIEMVRPTQAQRRDFGSQFSPSLESQLQRADSEGQEAVGSEGEAEGVGQSLRQPLAPERAISYFSLPGPVVGVAETAEAFQSGDARIVYLAPSDGGEVGRVVSLGDSCVIEMLVRMMDDEERRSDGDGVGILQERREMDGVVVTVADMGTMVVEAQESGGERRAEEWRSTHGRLSEWVEDPRLDGHELDSEDERDACSFKSTRGSIESSEPEGGKSGEEQAEGASRGGRAAGGFEGVGSAGSASAGSKGGDSGYEDDADSYGGNSGDSDFSSIWVAPR